MSDSLNNKELVAVGHQFAKAMSSDTAIMDIAKIVSRLAERLDCTTAALREMTKQRDAMAAMQQPGVDQKAVESLATDLMKRIDKITGERHSVATLSSLRMSIVEACRAAMLQGAEPVSQPYTLPTQGSEVVNEAAWTLFNMLTEHGPLNGHQFNNLKDCFYEALKVAMRNTAAPQREVF